MALIAGATGQDGAYLAEFLLSKGIRRSRHEAPVVVVQHRAHRPSHSRSARGGRFLPSALRRCDRRDQHHPHRAGNAAGRDLQSRGAIACAGLVRDAGIHRQRRRARDAAPARGHPHPRPGTARLASIRPRPPSCSARRRRSRRRRRRRSIRALPTRPQSSMPIGSRSTTARPMACTPRTASCSITRARFAARPSSPARSRARSRRSSAGCSRSCSSAISTPCATGAMRAILSRACG